jgi:hypothetical protein
LSFLQLNKPRQESRVEREFSTKGKENEKFPPSSQGVFLSLSEIIAVEKGRAEKFTHIHT